MMVILGVDVPVVVEPACSGCICWFRSGGVGVRSGGRVRFRVAVRSGFVGVGR